MNDRFSNHRCWFTVIIWAIRSHIYRYRNKRRNSTSELPDKSFEVMRSIVIEPLCLIILAYHILSLSWFSSDHNRSELLKKWMLFGFCRFVQKLWNRVIKIGDSTQAFLYVILDPLEVLTFLLMLESKWTVISIVYVTLRMYFFLPVS